MTKTLPRCPCGHPLDSNGDPGAYGCLNGRIYGPCRDPYCNGGCDDTAGVCRTLDGCCDPEEQELRARARRCTSEACDEYDGVHSYGDGCAMVRRQP